MLDELIQQFEVRLEASACHPDADWYVLFIRLDDDISQALPYLNAELEQPTDYRPNDGILFWKSMGRKYAFRPHEIAIATVSDNNEARKFSKNTIAIVNDIWRRKDQIAPSFECRKPLPNVLDIYKLLPGSNCQKCGSPTCMAFAVQLRSDCLKLSLCPYLSEQDFKKVVPENKVEPVA